MNPLTSELSGHFKYTITDTDSNIITHPALSKSSTAVCKQERRQSKNDWIGMEIYLKEGQSD